MLSPSSSFSGINAPEWIFDTSFPGTGGSEGDNTSGTSEVAGDGVLGTAVGGVLVGTGLYGSFSGFGEVSDAGIPPNAAAGGASPGILWPLGPRPKTVEALMSG